MSDTGPKLGDACEAMTFASDCATRCTHEARHWTHELRPGERRVLCTQHFKVMSGWRRRGTERALFAAWGWQV